MITVDVDATGPIFDRRADAISDQIVDDVADAVGKEANNMVQARLSQVLRHPTGRFQSQIATNRAFQSRVIHSDIIYSWWLEGTGSRNRTTRFKGYATFRLVKQELQGRAPAIARQVVNRRVGEL